MKARAAAATAAPSWASSAHYPPPAPPALVGFVPSQRASSLGRSPRPDPIRLTRSCSRALLRRVPPWPSPAPPEPSPALAP
eukprot:jgi/Chrpa1/1954/Chrysochromulina_OHIO_Genome00009869-RA